MNTTHKKRNRHLNEQPTYTGQFNVSTRVQLITYSNHSFKEQNLERVDNIRSHFSNKSVSWIRVHGMTDSTKIISLVTALGLDETDAKDILTTQHIAMVEENDTNVFIVVPISYIHEGQVIREQLAFIMGSDYLVSIQESDHTLFRSIYNAVESNNYQKFGNRKSDYLLASIINEVINYYADYITYLEDELEVLEDDLLDTRQLSPEGMITRIQEKRREVISLRKRLTPFKDQLAKLLRVDEDLIHTQEIPYFKDIYDQLLFILQNIESCREILSSLVDIYLNNNDVRMNQIMKQLTLVATIFIPLTFIVGVWGMNFRFMPELNWRYGYLFAWILMIGVGIGVWWYMKKKRWF
ncbi:magnesium/cobalt transporter CorA [Bacteroidales bacterium OttesenSCG-928-J19]|nr:magnesium/cobalt transporter CorA [Bacteroidales bacterium OttesenSCG-928-J19]